MNLLFLILLPYQFYLIAPSSYLDQLFSTEQPDPILDDKCFEIEHEMKTIKDNYMFMTNISLVQDVLHNRLQTHAKFR